MPRAAQPHPKIRKARAKLGGLARAEALSPRRRSEIAKWAWLCRQAKDRAKREAVAAAAAEATELLEQAK